MHPLQHGMALSLAVLLLAGPGDAVLPAPVDDERFKDFYTQGCSLMLQMTSEEPNPEYQLDWDSDFLFRAGWHMTKETIALEVRDELNVLAGWAAPRIPGQTTRGSVVLRNFLHDPKLTLFQSTSPITGDRYRFAQSTENRIVVIWQQPVNNDDITEQQNHPDLVHLSDLVNAEWCRFKHVRPSRVPPNFSCGPPVVYLVKDISQPHETSSVIRHCLQKDHGLDAVPMWSNAVTFHSALTASTHSLRPKMLKAFRGSSSTILSMMWTVNKFDDVAKKMLRENTQAETQPRTENDRRPVIPHPMRGTYNPLLNPGQVGGHGDSAGQGGSSGQGDSTIPRRAPRFYANGPILDGSTLGAGETAPQSSTLDPTRFRDYVAFGCWLERQCFGNIQQNEHYQKGLGSNKGLEAKGWVQSTITNVNGEYFAFMNGWKAESPVATASTPYLKFVDDNTITSRSWTNANDQVKYACIYSEKFRFGEIRKEAAYASVLQSELQDSAGAYLSDLLFHDWTHRKEASNGAGDGSPKYFLIREIQGPASDLNLFRHCLKTLHNLDHYPTWPGYAAFPMGTDCFHAMLAAHNIESIPFFLMAHKRHATRQPVLKSILAFQIQDDKFPSILLWTGAIMDKVVQDYAANMACPQDSPGHNFPYPGIGRHSRKRLSQGSTTHDDNAGEGSSTGHSHGRIASRGSDNDGNDKGSPLTDQDIADRLAKINWVSSCGCDPSP
ncbi:hypothetical protein DOTSEDRAFT_83036 [Dothistroma septosporum NZE10]|uniref:Uncharacterized protein n=1 Tax=Dothistroma septosporum (strain NZE10 / CBS 128990) TaxID=675120 RepID=M2WJR1_DOTSN|nr:hypothetical protein DOTSEDRAFT_83036 [Dothistroma septosporum NZE10]